MNWAHAHLLVNHLPVIGSLFATLLLVVAMLRRSGELQRVSLWGMVLVALLALPAFFTGEPVEEVVEELPGVSHDIIHEHEEMAETGIIVIEILGAVALGGAIFYRRAEKIPMPYLGAVLLLSLGSAAIMGITANLGGEIRRPELRGAIRNPIGAEGEHEDRGRGRGRGGR